MKAFDIKINSRPYRSDCALDCGWCFGLPPSIHSDQWPIDPDNGYPLMHAFTIKLPIDYRCRSANLAAISVFGTSFDMNPNGFPQIILSIKDVLRTDDGNVEDPILRNIRRLYRHEHPHCFKLRDNLKMNYAVIFLTEEEFLGPLCFPPQIIYHADQAQLPAPRWLILGAAAALYKAEWFENTKSIFINEPQEVLSYNLSLSVAERQCDPNAGIPVSEEDTLCNANAQYQSPYFCDQMDNLNLQFWAAQMAPNHFGGTMEPAQNLPEFSPFYIEFKQELGGFNFGDGPCQIDLKEIKANFTRF